MMRDANRIVGIDPPFGMYIFDYINVPGESIPAIAIRCSSTSMGTRLELLRVKNTRQNATRPKCYRSFIMLPIIGSPQHLGPIPS